MSDFNRRLKVIEGDGQRPKGPKWYQQSAPIYVSRETGEGLVCTITINAYALVATLILGQIAVLLGLVVAIVTFASIIVGWF